MTIINFSHFDNRHFFNLNLYLFFALCGQFPEEEHPLHGDPFFRTLLIASIRSAIIINRTIIV